MVGWKGKAAVVVVSVDAQTDRTRTPRAGGCCWLWMIMDQVRRVSMRIRQLKEDEDYKSELILQRMAVCLR